MLRIFESLCGFSILRLQADQSHQSISPNDLFHVESMDEAAHLVSVEIPLGNHELLVKLPSIDAARFARRMHAKSGQHAIENQRLIASSQAEPQVVVHCPMQRFIERARRT